jgi:hypothetical protein
MTMAMVPGFSRRDAHSVPRQTRSGTSDSTDLPTRKEVTAVETSREPATQRPWKVARLVPLLLQRESDSCSSGVTPAWVGR